MSRSAGVALLLLLVAGCGGRETDAGPVPDSVYVETMARLILLDTAVSPTLEPPLRGAALDSARDRILERWGVGAAELLEFARNRGEDPERMQAVWERVYDLSSALQEEDWSPEDPGGPDSVRAPATDSGRPTGRDPAADTASTAPDTTAAGHRDGVGAVPPHATRRPRSRTPPTVEGA